MDPISFLTDHSTALLSMASGLASSLGMLLISFWKTGASVERVKLKVSAEAASTEAAERAAFRASLMSELTDLRAQIKECEADKNVLHERLNAAEAQILILKASNEIMEKWVAFFRNGTPLQAAASSAKVMLEPVG